MIALIPARGGSVRIPRKNIRPLGDHPLLAYTIAAAEASRLFAGIFVSTEDPEIAAVARHYRATVIDRPRELATGTYPVTDREWMQHALDYLAARQDLVAYPQMLTWALLRPTAPFRTADTIRRASEHFHLGADGTHDSLRAVEPVRQHPGKMWTWEGPGFPMRPYVDKRHENGVPWHSSPTQSLPRVYVQNASLEMGWSCNIWAHGTIHGRKVIPFLTEGYEGFDLNTETDWRLAETLVATGEATLPPVAVAACEPTPWGV